MSMPDPYVPHAAFIAPARDGRPLWVVGAGLALSEIAFALSPLVLWPIFGLEFEAVLDGATPATLFVSLVIYCLPALALAVWIRRMHGGSGWMMIGPPIQAGRAMARAGAGVALLLLAMEVLPPYADLSEVATTRSIGLWLLGLPFAILAILVQSGSEEVVFRGYLQQQLAARYSSRLIWMLLPSILFGYLHFGNADGSAEGVLWALWATMLGIACADLTARTGNIGAAVGLHTANNVFAFCIFGMEDGPDSGFALFLYPYEAPGMGAGTEALLSAWALYDVVFSALFILTLWLAARIAIRR